MRSKLFSAVLIILLLVSCRNIVPKPAQPEPVRVRLTGVVTENLSLPVHANGILVSSEEMKLSFKTGGIVSKIFVREGDRVRKGELLASLNLSEIKSNAEQAKNGYDKALRDYKRAENLYRDSVATLEQKQNAETLMKMAKSNFDIVQFNLVHSRIEAPDNGVIMKKFVKENELIASGYPVFLFGTAGRYWKVTAGFPDKDIIKLNQGDSAVISFDAYPGVLFDATVDQVGEMSNPYTGTYETELRLNDKGYRLASGFVASVNIFPAEKRSFSMVPVGAIIEADGQNGYIYTVTASMTARKVKIGISELIGPMAAVTGIPAGVTEIVSEGAAYLRDGVSVEVGR